MKSPALCGAFYLRAASFKQCDEDFLILRDFLPERHIFGQPIAFTCSHIGLISLMWVQANDGSNREQLPYIG
jgi:hypothetical protein